MALTLYQRKQLEKLKENEKYQKIKQESPDKAEFLDYLYLEVGSYDFKVENDFVVSKEAYINSQYDVEESYYDGIFKNQQSQIEELKKEGRLNTSEETLNAIKYRAMGDFFENNSIDMGEYENDARASFIEEIENAIEQLEKENPNNSFLMKIKEIAGDFEEDLIDFLWSELGLQFNYDDTNIYDYYLDQDVYVDIADVGDAKIKYKGQVYNDEINSDLANFNHILDGYEVIELFKEETENERRKEIIDGLKEMLEKGNEDYLQSFGLFRLMQQNGFTIQNLSTKEEFDKIKENRFFQQILTELDNAYLQECNVYTYFVKMTIGDLIKYDYAKEIENELLKNGELKLEERKSITFKNVNSGIFNPTDGGGSVLEATHNTNYQVEIPLNNLYFTTKTLMGFSHLAMDAYSLSRSFYEKGEIDFGNIKNKQVVNPVMIDFVNNVEFKNENNLIDHIDDKLKNSKDLQSLKKEKDSTHKNKI